MNVSVFHILCGACVSKENAIISIWISGAALLMNCDFEPNVIDLALYQSMLVWGCFNGIVLLVYVFNNDLDTSICQPFSHIKFKFLA